MEERKDEKSKDNLKDTANSTNPVVDPVMISLSKFGLRNPSSKVTKNIVIEDETIRSISLDVLITLLTSESLIFSKIDKNDLVSIKNLKILLDCFLSTTAILPAHSDLILTHIINRFNSEISENPNDLTIPKNCCLILKKWTETSCQGVESKSIFALQNFCLELENNHNQILKEEGKEIESLLVQHLSSLNKSSIRKKQQKSNKKAAPAPILPPKLLEDGDEIMEIVDPQEIARQICLIDFQIFSMINLREFLGLSWSKPKYRHRSPNVLKMIYRFNDLSNWIASLIVLPKSIEKRKLMLKKTIECGHHLMKLGNYNSLQAVVAAFGHRAVKRLTATWEGLTAEENKKIAEMRDLLSKEKNSQKLRNATEDRISTKRPCCPYLGLYLTDLTFVEDANKDKVENPKWKQEEEDGVEKELLNWEKRMMIYKIFSTIRSLQLAPFNFVKVHQFQTKLLKLGGTISDPDQLMNEANEREREMQRE